jgi:hypothetical protein
MDRILPFMLGHLLSTEGRMVRWQGCLPSYMRCSRTGAAGLQDRPEEKMVSFVMTPQHAPPSSANNLLALFQVCTEFA